MFKKAGIIVSVTIIILAVAVYWFANRIYNKSEGETPLSSDQNQVVQEQVVQQPQQPVQTEPVQQPNQPTTMPTTVGPAQPSLTTTFSTINESSLGEAVSKHNEVMIVAEKKVILLDGKIGTSENKQLVYCVDVLGNDNRRLSIYLNGVAYKGLTVGAKLQVEYEVYKNDVGTQFPTIISVNTIN